MSGGSDEREARARQVLKVLSSLASEQVVDFAAFRVSAGAMKHMWTRLLAETSDASLGLHLGEVLGPMSNTVNVWAYTTGNPRVALDLVAKHWRVVSPITRAEIVQQGDRLCLRYVMLHGFEPLPVDIEYRMVAWLTMLRWMVGLDLSPIRAVFPFSEPAYADEFARIFRCPIEWNCPLGELWFRTADLSATGTASQPHGMSSPPAWIDRVSQARHIRSLVAQVEAAIESGLERNEFGVRRVAETAGMSERTLLRKLHERGVKYRQLVEGVRKRRAAHLMRGKRRPLKEVARLLGYSNSPNFVRAFRRWYGVPPVPRPKSP